MNINDIHDFVYEGDEDYELAPDTFGIDLAIELVLGGAAYLTIEADSKEDVVAALVQVVESNALSQIIEKLEAQ